MAKRKHYIGAVGDFTGADIRYMTRFFVSAGSHFIPGYSMATVWLPWCGGAQLRNYWRTVAHLVKRKVPARAYALMELHFNSSHAKQFEDWCLADKREVYELCVPTGCEWWVDPLGNVLPLGVTTQDLLRARSGDVH
jgi:hypothetical protein